VNLSRHELIFLTLVACFGCSSEGDSSSRNPEHSTGSIALPLSVESGSVTYRFVGSINLRSAADDSIVQTIHSDLSSPSTQLVSLLPGAYTLEVVEGYSCSVAPADPTFTGCSYLEGAPTPFEISAGGTTELSLSFEFHFEEDVEVVFSKGDATLTLDPVLDQVCGGACAADELCVSLDGAEPACALTCTTSDDCQPDQFCATTEAGNAVCVSRTGHDYELTTSFSVEAGVEDRRCTIVDVGNASPIKLGQLDLTASSAVYAVTLWAVDGTPGASDCSELGQAATRRLLLTKSAHENLSFPEGVGYSLEAHQSLLVEAHLLNPTDALATADVTLGLDAMPAQAFEHEAGLLLVEDLGINVPAQATSTLTGFHALGAVLDGGSIFRLVGYTHAWGTQVMMTTSATRTGAQTVVYEPVWDPNQPPFVDPSPAIVLPDAGGLRLSCTFHNTTNQTLRAGASTSDERCAALVYYAGAVAEQTCLKQGSTAVCCASGKCP